MFNIETLNARNSNSKVTLCRDFVYINYILYIIFLYITYLSIIYFNLKRVLSSKILFPMKIY